MESLFSRFAGLQSPTLPKKELTPFYLSFPVSWFMVMKNQSCLKAVFYKEINALILLKFYKISIKTPVR